MNFSSVRILSFPEIILAQHLLVFSEKIGMDFRVGIMSNIPRGEDDDLEREIFHQVKHNLDLEQKLEESESNYNKLKKGKK
jgi:hypothetical protein